MKAIERVKAIAKVGSPDASKVSLWRVSFEAAIYLVSIVALGFTLWFIFEAYEPVIPVIGANRYILLSLHLFAAGYLVHFFSTGGPIPRPFAEDATRIWVTYRIRQLYEHLSYFYGTSGIVVAIMLVISYFYIVVGQGKALAHMNSYIESQCEVGPDCRVTASHCPNETIFNLEPLLRNVSWMGFNATNSTETDAESICSNMVSFGCYLKDSSPCEYGTDLKLTVSDIWAQGMAPLVAVCFMALATFCAAIAIDRYCPTLVSDTAVKVLVLVGLILTILVLLIGIYFVDFNRESDVSPFRAEEVLKYESTPECFGYKRASYLIRHNESYALGYGQCDGTFGLHSPPDIGDVRFNRTSDNFYTGEHNDNYLVVGAWCVASQYLTFYCCVWLCKRPSYRDQQPECLEMALLDDEEHLGVQV